MIKAQDPVEYYPRDNAWYFWNETWSDDYGPYKTESIARANFAAYCLDFLNHGDYKRPTTFGEFVQMLTFADSNFEFSHKEDQYLIIIATVTFYFSSDTGKLLNLEY